NCVLKQVASGLALALVFPVVFKLVDLLSPFRGVTVTAFFAIWATATTVWLAWRVRGRETLDGAAANIDAKADAHDEIKTAYWFIRNPRPSLWVDTQIRRAAASASKIQIDQLYPRRMPRSSYLVAALVFLLGVLNFLPLPWNPNWFYLQSAPAFSLTDTQRDLLDRAVKLLRQAQQLQQTDLAQKLSDIVRALQDGSMSKDEL